MSYLAHLLSSCFSAKPGVEQQMTILDRYIGLALARSALLVILILLPLFALLDLVQQLEE